MFNLGDRLKDKVTGFAGIATAKVEYLNDCVQFHLSPKTGKDGKYPEGHYIDEEQLEIVEAKAVTVKRSVYLGLGGDKDNTPNGKYPG